MEEPQPDLLPKPTLEDALTPALALRLLVAVGMAVVGIGLAVTQLVPLVVVGAIAFCVGGALYLWVEWRVADIVYPRHWGLFDPRVGIVLRLQLLTVGIAQAVRITREQS